MTVFLDTWSDSIAQFVGDGVDDFYAYQFLRQEDFDVVVIVDNVLQIQDEDYIETPLGIQFTVPPANGADVFIYRVTQVSQLRDFRPFGPFPAELNEDAVDKLVILMQETADGRGNLNLVTLVEQLQVQVVNNRGDNAVLVLWDGTEDSEVAGVVSIQAAENTLPPRNALYDNDFRIFMSYEALP